MIAAGTWPLAMLISLMLDGDRRTGSSPADMTRLPLDAGSSFVSILSVVVDAPSPKAVLPVLVSDSVLLDDDIGC